MSFKTYSRMLSITALGLLLVPATACASSAEHAANSATSQTLTPQGSAYAKAKPSHSDYAKPSAGVTVSHDYKGYSKLGAVENIRVTFKEAEAEGVMTVKVLPSADLNIATSSDVQTYQVSDADMHEMNLNVSSNLDGQFYVNLLITLDKGVGNVSTLSYGIPIYVGSAVPSKQGSGLKSISETKKVSGGLIVMDAEETIIQ